MKGTVAEMVINEIACLDPPGRFLEPQADQRFRQVSRKRAIEKTCQALREKKNNIGPRPAQNAAVVPPDDTDNNNNNAEADEPEQTGNEKSLPSSSADPTVQPHAAPTVKGDTAEAEGSKNSVTVMYVQ